MARPAEAKKNRGIEAKKSPTCKKNSENRAGRNTGVVSSNEKNKDPQIAVAKGGFARSLNKFSRGVGM